MSSSLRPNSERHGWQISTMAPPRIKSADLARHLRHRGLLLLLAGAEREPDRVEIEKHGHGMPDLQHGAGKVEPGSTAPGIPRGHVEQERMVFRAGQGAGEVVVRLAGRDRRHQPATEDKTEQENDDPLHGCDLAPARRLRRLSWYSRPNRLKGPWRDP